MIIVSRMTRNVSNREDLLTAVTMNSVGVQEKFVGING